MKERRKHPRVEMELPVTLLTQGRFVPAATVDISLGGLCLLTDFSEKIENGWAEVVIDFSEKIKDVALRAKILRFGKGIGQSVALEFSNTRSEGYKTLKKFLHQYASK